MKFPFVRRPNAPVVQPIKAALVRGDTLYLDDDLPAPIRSSLERDFRNLQMGAAGVSDYGLTSVIGSVVVIYACVEWIADQAAMLPLIATDPSGEIVESSPFTWFLNNQAAQVMDEVSRSLSVWGKAFIRKQYNVNRYPTGLEVINPNNIQQQVNQQTLEITDYRMARTGEHIDPSQIIYIPKYSYTGDGNPLSPTEAAFIEAGIQQGISTHAVAFFFNQALPTGMITFDPPLNPVEYDIAKERWRKEFRGASKAHKINIMNNKATFTPFQVAMKDLALDTLDDSSKQKSIAAFRINPAVLGLGDVAAGLNARSTFEDTKRASIEGAVLPVGRLIARELTRQWAAVDFSPPNYYIIQTNEREMPGLSDINTERAGMALNLVTGGGWDYDEMRTYLGSPIQENSDERLFLRGHTGQPLSMWQAGTINLTQFHQLVGLPLPPVNMRVIDGKTVPEMALMQVLEANVPQPVAPEPPALPFAPSVPGTIAPPAPRPALPAASLSHAPYFERAEGMQAVISIPFAHHNLLKMARRQLAKTLGAQEGVEWVDDSAWRLDMLSLENCTPALAGELIYSFAPPDAPPVELWTGDFDYDGESIRLLVDTPDTLQTLRSAVSGHLSQEFAAGNAPVDTPSIVMCRVSGWQGEIEPVTAMPLMVDSLSLVADGVSRYTWQIDRVTEKQRGELRAWQHAARNAIRRGKPLEFQVEELPEHVAVFVREQLVKGELALNELFAQARKRLANRAIQSTRDDFMSAMDTLLGQAQSGSIDQRTFSILLGSLISDYGYRAYRDGLIDGGVTDGTFSTDDNKTMMGLVQSARDDIRGVADNLFKDGLTDAEVAGRSLIWFNGAIIPIYHAGLMSADADGMYEFTRVNNTKEPCADCLRLEGQVHRLREWEENNLLVPRPEQATACKGYQCGHTLKKVQGRAKGNF